MKIWCDVCDKEEASVFCCADEAALCNGCDRHVHFANKLAGKHLRFSLTSPTFKDAPLCDICGERRALLFCQEDRAILCRECDIPIHQANEHTKKHNRFLLTGVKISASPSAYPRASNSNSAAAFGRAKTRPKSVSSEVPSSASNEVFTSSSSTTTSNCYYGIEENYHHVSDSGSGSGCTGSISEYLMETLPGWRVEDLLEHPSCVSYEDNIITNNNNSESYRVYDGSSQFHHQGFWDHKPFS
ncbi:B-box zinc finger protein 20 [Arabidopsis thaliana]|uniref:BZS1 n=2 Tax=Arabidopsis TaxID=3701 RepID=A0A178UV68_ARATH|nr:B-box-type zinc finger [Arabidopsis thaliana x Arabidopsis arenosa]OAO97926.1 BZS1 [Arabidopsis thaliana]